MARTLTPDEPPRNYFAAARSYLEFCAIGQRATPKHSADIFRYALPKRLLLGFCVELYLKSFLRHKGISSDALQFRPYGHDLSKLLEDCLSRGIQIAPQTQDAIEQLSRSHKQFENRYVKSGSFYVDMSYRYMIWALCLLDDSIAPIIGIQNSQSIDIGSLPE